MKSRDRQCQASNGGFNAVVSFESALSVEFVEFFCAIPQIFHAKVRVSSSHGGCRTASCGFAPIFSSGSDFLNISATASAWLFGAGAGH